MQQKGYLSVATKGPKGHHHLSRLPARASLSPCPYPPVDEARARCHAARDAPRANAWTHLRHSLAHPRVRQISQGVLSFVCFCPCRPLPSRLRNKEAALILCAPRQANPPPRVIIATVRGKRSEKRTKRLRFCRYGAGSCVQGPSVLPSPTFLLTAPALVWLLRWEVGSWVCLLRRRGETRCCGDIRVSSIRGLAPDDELAFWIPRRSFDGERRLLCQLVRLQFFFFLRFSVLPLQIF